MIPRLRVDIVDMHRIPDSGMKVAEYIDRVSRGDVNGLCRRYRLGNGRQDGPRIRNWIIAVKGVYNFVVGRAAYGISEHAVAGHGGLFDQNRIMRHNRPRRQIRRVRDSWCDFGSDLLPGRTNQVSIRDGFAVANSARKTAAEDDKQRD